MTTPKKLRSVCYTLNNYTPEQVETLQSIDCTYHVFGKEIGESGTPHLQGFIHFPNAKTFSSMRKLLFNSHLEPRRGTPEQAATYCKKDDKDAFEKGTLPQQGRRTDIESLVDDLKNNYEGNATAFFLSEPQRTARMYRFVDRIAPPLQKKRDWLMNVIWLWGPTGTGKSHWAHQHHPDAYWKNMDEEFWEDYDGQDTVVLDDIRGHHMKYTTLLRLFDRYPLGIKVKGRSARFRSTTIICTSNVHPSMLYQKSSEDLEQLIRRITEIREMTERHIE